MTIKDRILRIIPPRYELAARFHFSRVLGRLDDEARIIDQIAQHPRMAIDIGANVGLYAYRLAQLFPRVAAFEPIADCARIIANSSAPIEVYCVALSSRTGDGILSMPRSRRPEDKCLASLSNDFGDGTRVTVPLRTLDSYGFTNVDFIKIDVEGHELEVLRGAIDTIRRCEPAMLIEIEQRHHRQPIDEVFREIQSLNYDGSFLPTQGRRNGRREDSDEPGSLLAPLSAFCLTTHQSGDSLSRNYINNFVFRRNQR
ncbi:MAG: FkbM family methyltransferase [Betaproteobacteria bacterium]